MINEVIMLLLLATAAGSHPLIADTTGLSGPVVAYCMTGLSGPVVANTTGLSGPVVAYDRSQWSSGSVLHDWSQWSSGSEHDLSEWSSGSV